MKQTILAPVLQAPVNTASSAPVLKSVTPIVLMDEATLSVFVEALKTREAELIEDKLHNEGVLQELAEGYGDDAERNVVETKARAEIFRTRAIRELSKVQSALFRAMNDLKGPARNPSYVPFGKCLQPECGNDIELGRLESVPYEPTCMAHKGCSCVGDGKSHRN